MRLPLGMSDFIRSIAETPAIRLQNRFFEQSPQDTKEQVALLSRPALKKWITLDTSPVRALYSCPGAFFEALFAVGGNTVYQIEQDETVTALGVLDTVSGFVSMAATDTHLFIADGLSLRYYTTEAFALGTLTASGAIAVNDVVQIGANYYKFTSGDVDTGSPAGTVGNPWLVALGSNNTDALRNLADAIDETGTAGTTYSTALEGSTEVTVYSTNATTLVIRANEHGTAGNSIATTETGASIAWGAATLAGGGATTFAEIDVPDGSGIVSVGVIAGYTICVVAQGYGQNGRFYWIEPGETTIDPLNFATAERSPDPVWNVVVVNDQFWLPGTSTNEVWYPSGDGAAPFLRQQGRLFDKGVWEGTVLQIKDSVMAVGTDGMPYRVTDQPMPIGTPGIVQRIREAINVQRLG